MQKVLITGASGLLGSHLVPILRNEYELHLLQRSAVTEKENHVSFQQVDLSRAELPQLPSKMDAIIYLAQSENYRDFPESAIDVFQVNTVQVMKMLDYGRRAGVRKFIFASTGGVYNSNEVLHEDLPVLANGKIGFYATTKLCSEMLAENYSAFFDVVLLRFFFIYGKGQKPFMLMPRLVDSIKTEKPIQLAGEDGLKINPIHASDAALAVKAALKMEGSAVINVAGPGVVSLKEIAGIISDKVGKPPVFEIDRSKAASSLIADITKMKEKLIAPQVTFEKGIDELI